jgi:hypothetical protein
VLLGPDRTVLPALTLLRCICSVRMPPDGILMGPIETSRWAHGGDRSQWCPCGWGGAGSPHAADARSTAASRQSHALPNGDLGSVRSRKTIYSVDAIPLSAVKRATITCRDSRLLKPNNRFSFRIQASGRYFGRNGPC